MSAFLDDSLVGVLLLISAAYAFSALGPRSLRRRAFNALSVWLARASAVMGMGRVALYREPLQRVAQRLARAAETKAPGACGGCDNCGAGQPGAGQPGAGQPDARTPGVEVKPKEVTVPIAHIGRARR